METVDRAGGCRMLSSEGMIWGLGLGVQVSGIGLKPSRKRTNAGSLKVSETSCLGLVFWISLLRKSGFVSVGPKKQAGSKVEGLGFRVQGACTDVFSQADVLTTEVG